MKKDYTGKRTTVALDPDLAKRIKKLLKGKKIILADYTREALDEKLHVDESKMVLENLAKITSTEQYHKIKQVEHDLEELKRDHVTAKELGLLELEIIAVEKKVDRNYKKLISESKSRIHVLKESLAVLKKDKKNK